MDKNRKAFKILVLYASPFLHDHQHFLSKTYDTSSIKPTVRARLAFPTASLATPACVH